jgi:DnaJ-class molecular chaperone
MAKFESKGYYIFVTPYRAVGEGKDYYEVLGVPRHAAQSDIRRAYERLEQEWGPDSGNPSPLREERWQEIQEAYAVLGNKTTQATYDLTGGKELERKEFEFAYILAYPEDEQHDLEKKFEKPDKLCIIKERGKKLSVIEKC